MHNDNLGLNCYAAIDSVSLVSLAKGNDTCTKILRAMHKHDDRLEILFITEGAGLYIIDGVRYYAGEGDIIIINKDTAHEEIAVVDGGATVYSCAVKNLHIKGLKPNCLISDEKYPIIRNLSEDKKREIGNMFFTIHNNINKKNIYAKQIAVYVLKALLMNVLELTKNCTNKVVSRSNINYPNNICCYINNHFEEVISLEKIARAINLNQYYIAHIFKKHVGNSIIEYVIKCRIGEAQSYLLQTSRNVSDIAYEVGFNSGSYFQTAFKRYIGVTPKEFRNYWTNSIYGEFINLLR